LEAAPDGDGAHGGGSTAGGNLWWQIWNQIRRWCDPPTRAACGNPSTRRLWRRRYGGEVMAAIAIMTEHNFGEDDGDESFG